MTSSPDVKELRARVRDAYSHVALEPGAQHPFVVGRRLADRAGYPAHELDLLPAACVAAFAGVAYIHAFARFRASAVVLDVGCGAGLDSLLAARRAEVVIGIDFSAEMLQIARASAAAVGAGNVDFRQGDAESLPIARDSIDVALVNGIFNLNPRRHDIFQELARVLRPGGEAFVAELVLKEGTAPPGTHSEADWFS